MFTVDLYFYFKITFCSYILWSLKRLFKQHSCKYKLSLQLLIITVIYFQYFQHFQMTLYFINYSITRKIYKSLKFLPQTYQLMVLQNIWIQKTLFSNVLETFM